MTGRAHVVGILAAGTAFVAAGLGTAFAGKPAGGGGGTTEGGAVYFAMSGSVWTMAPDGSGKSRLPVAVSETQTVAPSHALHAGRRWFLRVQPVGTDPDGGGHGEVFAVPDDGAAPVQLTSHAALDAAACAWEKGDAFVSYAAVDWTVTAAPVSRLLRVAVAFDAAGVPSASAAPASVVVVPAVLGTGYRGSAIGPHDWSPDGSRIVWQDLSAGPSSLAEWTLKITTVATGATATIATGADSPRWSGDGAAIVFQSTAGIDTVAPTGAGRVTIVKTSRSSPTVSYALPCWSPSSASVLYARLDSPSFPATGTTDVWRATSSGSSKTELTADVADAARPLGWR